MRGKPPKFFEGNSRSFEGLMFDIEHETFEFWQPVKMRDNPMWLNVTEIMKSQDVTETFESQLEKTAEHGVKLPAAISRLTKVQNIKNIEFHIERISGDDKTIDVVVDIFNRVNSGGTHLSKGDLALAKICAQWPEAREAMNEMLATWRKHGYDFGLDWLLRCVNAVATGDALFTSLTKVSTDEFKIALAQTRSYIDYVLNVMAGRLGIDHGAVLKGVFAIPVMVRYLHLNGGKLTSAVERDRLLYWYLHAMLWGRFSGSTESKITQDLRLLDGPGDPLQRLIDQLRQQRGSLRILQDDFSGSTTGSRFYPFLYVLTRSQNAKDLNTGIPVRLNSLGKLSRLELHHIIPKSLLYAHGEYSRNEVNAVANFVFQSQASNLEISNRNPEEYLASYEAAFPGVLTSQWIPEDPQFWSVENYREFLARRRELLADAANQFLDSLLSGNEPDVQPETALSGDDPEGDVPEEEAQIVEFRDWMAEQGLPIGTRYLEIVDDSSGRLEAFFDLAWPNGIQEGLSDPVALLLDANEDEIGVASSLGYRTFESLPDLREYVETEVLIEDDLDGSSALLVATG